MTGDFFPSAHAGFDQPGFLPALWTWCLEKVVFFFFFEGRPTVGLKFDRIDYFCVSPCFFFSLAFLKGAFGGFFLLEATDSFWIDGGNRRRAMHVS